MSKAPWTDAQVKALNDFQHCGYMHPFTCGNDSETLIATNTGWECPKCNYKQDWAHDFMFLKLRDPFKDFRDGHEEQNNPHDPVP
jgi:hypothetical protein